MARLVFTQDNLPTPEEFRQLLLEAMMTSNPIDELLSLAKDIGEYERKYKLTSAEFYSRYQRGEMGDERDIMRWAMLYRAFTEHKSRIEIALMREAILRTEAVPA